MKVVKKDGLRILTAGKGKHIRAIDDVYKEATETEPEYIPYYTDKIYLGVNVDESKIDELYVEEKIETE